MKESERWRWVQVQRWLKDFRSGADGDVGGDVIVEGTSWRRRYLVWGAREVEMIESIQVENNRSRENHVDTKPRVLFLFNTTFDGTNRTHLSSEIFSHFLFVYEFLRYKN